MQILQPMDLDQINEMHHHPIKPLLNRKNKVLTRSNRVFGLDITNQSRRLREKESKSKAKGKKAANNNDINIISKPSLSIWDMPDVDDDLFVTDYIGDIMTNLRLDEDTNAKSCIIGKNSDFMTKQKDINARMRIVLVDWLVEVHRKFKLLPSTYFLAVNLLDRFLSKQQLHRRKLQLCGCTCLWIASKYQEIYAPEMDDFIYISDNAFTAHDLTSMEILILKTLSFTLTVPTVYNYSERYRKISAYYLKREKEKKIISDLIMYCIEHCVMSYKLCRLKPSLISAAAFVYSCVATKVFSLETFKNDKIAGAIGYGLGDGELMRVMKEINIIVGNAKRSKHKAVFKKYSKPKYSNISKLNFAKLNTSFLNQN